VATVICSYVKIVYCYTQQRHWPFFDWTISNWSRPTIQRSPEHNFMAEIIKLDQFIVTTFVLPNRILSKYFKKKNTINGSIAGDFKVSIYCDHHVQLTLLSFMLQCLTLCNVE
jgi:hypothetical protein